MSVAYSNKVLSFPRDHFCHLFNIQDNPVTVCEMIKALNVPETDPGKMPSFLTKPNSTEKSW